MLFLITFFLSISFVRSQSDLNTAQNFGVLAATTVTSAGLTVVNGNVGVSPGIAITGFPPAVLTGTTEAGTTAAGIAMGSVAYVYGQLKGQTCLPNMTNLSLDGATLTPGVYCFSTSASITTTLTLDGQNKNNPLFVFQMGSTFITATSAKIILISGALPCGIFWQVGSSATVNSASVVGVVIAYSSISVVASGSTCDGGLFALNGAVTLQNTTVKAPGNCTSVQIPVVPNTPARGSAATAFVSLLTLSMFCFVVL
jgi:hypothetical protein